MKGTVCVTGAAGFLGSSLVKRLLENGYTVHATVRYPDNKAKVSHLLSLPGAEERLKLFRADLLEDGSFDDAIVGCDGVFHVASPVEIDPTDPESDVIKPAIEGTMNVLKACTKAKTVKRVVLTSSITAVCIHDSSEQKQYIDEPCWSDVNFLRTKTPGAWAYSVSKTLAEQAAWKYANEHELDMVTIIPAIVAGPFITPIMPASIQLALAPLMDNPLFFQGLKETQTLAGSVSLVHVEDVCRAQIFLMENLCSHGRHICAAINISVPQLTQHLAQRYPQYNVPTESIQDLPVTPRVNISSKKLVDSGFTFEHGLDEIYEDTVKYSIAKGWLA